MKTIRSLLLALIFVSLLSGYAAWPAAAQEMDHLHVNVDVRPGTDDNTINLNSRSTIPVALFGAADFDVSNVDLSTVGFGPMHMEGGAAPVKVRFVDINRDGYRDILFHFRAQETGLQPGDTEACLHGMLLDGTHFCGHDTVTVIG